MTASTDIAFRETDILSEMAGDILVLTLNRPQVLNAWTAAGRGELAARIRTAEKNPGVAAIVLTGAGTRAFCAGQDLKETGAKKDSSHVVAVLHGFADCYDAVRLCTKPVVAALNGLAAGSGFQFAQCCDYVVAHEGVRLGQSEVTSGMPSILGTWMMWERIGSRAFELVLMGRLMGAQEAAGYGFINDIVPEVDVMSKALEIARKLAAQPKHAFRITKLYNRKLEEERYQHAIRLSIEAQSEAFESGAAQEVIREFLNKRGAHNGTTQSE